jgi:SWI/SNF-related matrix-associated actin-dependent regulator of chromatin subfamily A-like protein 1
MELDYTGKDFIVRLNRGEGDPRELMTLRGLDYSTPASTPAQSVLYTQQPWGVADLIDIGTPAARAALAPTAARIDASRAPESGSHFKMPADQELWGFQKASLDYLLSGTGQGLIADEPGLGKTPQAIVYANEIGARRVLVICPAAIRMQWARKIKEWSVMREPYLVYPVYNARNGVHPTAEWVVLSYALARAPGIVAAIAKQDFDLVIMDESHYLKEPTSQQTRAIFGQADGQYHPKGFDPLPSIVSRARHALCLSGTPIVNRPLEAYTTARALAWDSIDYLSLDRFRVRFNPQKETTLRGGKRFKEERIGRVIELGNRMRGTFMARHAKRDVMTQLKFPRYEVIRYEETKEIKKLIEAESLLGIDIDAVQTTNNYEMLGHIATLRREMGVAAAPQAAEYIKILLDGGVDKITVFAWHIEVLNILQHKLMMYGVLRIDGSTTPKVRQERVDAFMSQPKLRIMLGNIQSMGTGVDGLQKVCTRCVLVEPSWTPGENQQAIDRLDRGGQTGSVQADFLVPPGSVIEKILVSALNKAKVIHETLK